MTNYFSLESRRKAKLSLLQDKQSWRGDTWRDDGKEAAVDDWEGMEKRIKNLEDAIADLKSKMGEKDVKVSEEDKEELKQETLEEVAEKKYPLTNILHLQLNTAIRTGFEEGAKWQQERMYSEEEVGEIVYKNSYKLKACNS